MWVMAAPASKISTAATVLARFTPPINALTVSIGLDCGFSTQALIKAARTDTTRKPSMGRSAKNLLIACSLHSSLGSDSIGTEALFLYLRRFLYANRHPLRSKTL